MIAKQGFNEKVFYGIYFLTLPKAVDIVKVNKNLLILTKIAVDNQSEAKNLNLS